MWLISREEDIGVAGMVLVLKPQRSEVERDVVDVGLVKQRRGMGVRGKHTTKSSQSLCTSSSSSRHKAKM